MILAVDPGYTSGSCVADQVVSADEFNVVGAFEIGWFARQNFFATFFRTNASRLTSIIIERYVLFDNEETIRSQIGSEIPSARVIGLIEGIAACYGIADKIRIQETWTRRQVTVLVQHREIVGLSKHNQDAYRHLRYFLKTYRLQPI